VNPNAKSTYLDTTRGKYRLPFEAIETVTAVVIYDKQAFERAGLTWSGSSQAQIAAFFADRGRTLVFAPTTGAVVRE
jgi:hypothetical protein